MKAVTINAARIVGPMRVEFDWSTGQTLAVDLAKWVASPFEALRDPAFFAQMAADDWGHGIGWPGGLDLGADTLYALCLEQRGEPSHAMLWEWMRRNGLTQERAAAAIGISRRMLNYYLACTKPIPKTVWLACLGWESQRDKPIRYTGKRPPAASRVAA